MVKKIMIFFFLVLVWGFSLNSCNNDLFGLFDSNSLDSRMQAHDTSDFLKSRRDLGLALGINYSFIVLSDTHIEGSSIRKLEELKTVIKNKNVKFVVFNGDVTQNGKERDAKIFLENAEYLGVPCFPVIGNHDVFFGNWPVWKEFLGPSRYRIDSDNATLFMLDTANAYFGSQQLDWLEKELKSAVGHVFVFTHTNLFVKSPVDIQQFTDNRERARFTSMLKGRCDAVFMGHIHRRIVNTAGGVPYITTDGYVVNTTLCHVLVSDDGISWEFITL